MTTWLSLGLIGWCLLMMIRYLTNQLPKLNKITIIGYIRGFLFSLIIGPISIAFFAYLLWGSND